MLDTKAEIKKYGSLHRTLTISTLHSGDTVVGKHAMTIM